MNLRLGTVQSAAAGTATVSLDGVDVEVLVLNDATLTAGSVAVLLQEGRRLVAYGTVPSTLPSAS